MLENEPYHNCKLYTALNFSHTKAKKKWWQLEAITFSYSMLKLMLYTLSATFCQQTTRSHRIQLHWTYKCKKNKVTNILIPKLYQTVADEQQMVHTTLHAVTNDNDTSLARSWKLASRWHTVSQSGVYPRIWKDRSLWAFYCQLDWCLVMAIRLSCLQLHYTELLDNCPDVLNAAG